MPTNRILQEEEQSRRISIIKDTLSERIPDPVIAEKLATELLRGAEDGLEITTSFDDWFNSRFKYQLVWLDANDYTRALVRALWLARTFAGTDYGTSRQRDMAQVWTDTARGFAGEIALARFLRDKFEVESEADTSRGHISHYLDSDVTKIRTRGSDWRTPQLKVSIKSTKFNGRWLDAPGAQLNHSDIFILVKLGITRQHFLGFLKDAGFIKSLILKAKSLEELTEADANILLGEIPASYPLPAYITGWIDKGELNLPIHMLNARVYGRTRKRILVSQGIGLMTPDVIRNHPTISITEGSDLLPIEIEPIIKSFTGQKFLSHSGGMKFGEDWQELINRL